MSNQVDGDGGENVDVESDHLDGVECGAGCTEIWEHVSDQRRAEQDRASDD